MAACVAVVGGGISGLAAAVRLRELAPRTRVLLLEAGPRLGGVVHTARHDGFLIEEAADGFLTMPGTAVALCERLRLAESLREPDATRRRAYVVCHGALEPIPEGFAVLAPGRLWPLVKSPVLSLPGKLRAALEYFVPRRRDEGDESLRSFVCRRFGREVYERLAQPLVGGIYSADPEHLSILATLPRFRQMERERGSLLRAMLHRARAASSQPNGAASEGRFATPAEGMAALVGALADQLPPGTVRLHTPVDAVVADEAGRWMLALGGNAPRVLTVDGLVLATPAHQSAAMLQGADAELARELRQIEYASCAVVSLGYRREQIGHSLDGFGFVVPLVEERLILSCSFSSVKYPGRAPEGHVLLRVFVGGACQAGLMRLPGPTLIELARREVGDLLRIEGEPVLQRLVRHESALPQYHVGHPDRVRRIERAARRHPTLALAGSGLGGVGVPSCIQSGQRAAEQLAAAVGREAADALQPA